MDHLQIPVGAHHIELRYLGKEEYDNGEFCSYPQRKGWTRAELRGENNYGGRTAEEVNAFFQTWLFFGCLITVFRSVGVEVQTVNFVRTTEDGSKFLTTGMLPELLQRWRTGQRKGGTWANKKHLETAHLNSYLGRKTRTPVKSALEDHCRYMVRYCGSSGALFPDVAIAVVTLQWTLSYWENGINYSNWTIDHKFAAPEKARRFLEDRLLNAGWCPSEAAWIMRDMYIDGQYYAGCLPSPRYEDDHSLCNADNQKCGYSNKDWKYETRHVTDDCNCAFEQAPENIFDIIRKGGVPIMSLVDGELRAVKFDATKMRYVAISHVWSDGMGNELGNALPRCQLIRLQRLTEEVDCCRRNAPPLPPISERLALAESPPDFPDKESSVDRYADTELVGFWLDTLCIPVQPDELRIDQIGKMRHIYKDASCVLVLDSWVQSIATTADIHERFLRLYLSNWQRRLWTCQEGVFARTLYFQFSDRQKMLEELVEEAGLRHDGPLECTISATSLNIPAFNEGNLEAFGISERVEPILSAVRARTTSKKKDETVCIATLLGLEPDPILHIRDGPNKDICDRRMERLIDMVETIPQGLIFNKMERLTSTGYRWAPRTFLGQKLSQPLWEADQDMLNSEDGTFIPGHGLMVHYPAYLLDMASDQAAISMAISNGKKHYKVHLSIDETALSVRIKEQKPETKPAHRIWKHPDYAVKSEKYALVTDSIGSPNAVLCALETILGEDDFVWPVHKLRYICPAAMAPTKLEGGGESIVSFRVQKKWEWIIG